MHLFQQVTNVHDVFDCVLILTLFGGVTTVRNVTDHGLRQSKVSLIVAVVLMLANIINILFTPQSIDKLVEANESIVNATSNVNINRYDQDFVVKMINSMSVSLASLASRLLTISRMKHSLPKILNNLARVDADLRLDPKLLRQNARFVYLMIIFQILLCLPVQLASVFIFARPERWIVTIMFTVNCFNNFTVACCEFQFIILTYLIKKRFKFINEKLCMYGDIQETILKQNYVLDGSVYNNKRLLKTAYYDIKMLHTSFKQLNGILEQLNKYYSMQLLLSVACCNLNMLINIYFAIFGGYYKPEDKSKAPQTVEESMNDFGWGTYYFARFVLLAAFTSKVVNECKRTRIEVSKIQIKFFDVKTAEEIKDMLQYSSNIYPQITALGLITIDLRLVTSAIATGCTYLVIMAQFNNDKNGCKPKI